MASTLADFYILTLIEAFEAGHTDSYLFRAPKPPTIIPHQLSTLNSTDTSTKLRCQQTLHNLLEAGSDILFLCHGSMASQVLHSPQSCCLACLRRTVSTLPEEEQSILTHYARLYVRLCMKCGTELEHEKGVPIKQKCICPPAMLIYLRNDDSRFWSEKLQDYLRQPRRLLCPICLTCTLPKLTDTVNRYNDACLLAPPVHGLPCSVVCGKCRTPIPPYEKHGGNHHMCLGCWNPISVDLTEGWEWDDVRDGFRMDEITLQRVQQHKKWREEQLVQRMIGQSGGEETARE